MNNEAKNHVKVLSKVTTISPEGIRFFEKKGIIHPDYDKESGYRVYGGDDTNMIQNYRKLRRLGFSLAEASDLLKESSNETYLAALTTRKAALEDEIKEAERTIHVLEMKIRQAQELCNQLGKYTITTRPAFYWMHTRINRNLLKDSKSLDASAFWADLYPYPDTLLIWDLGRLLSGKGNVYFGHLVEASVVENQELPGAYYAEETTCLYTVNETCDFMNSSYTMFDKMLDYMRENGLEPSGDAMARKVRVWEDDNQHYHYLAQLWIPIKS